MSSLVPIQLKLPPDVLARLDAACRSGERTRFIVDAIREKLDEAGGVGAYQAGYRKGMADMYGRLNRVLELTRGGVDVDEAANRAFREGWE